MIWYLKSEILTAKSMELSSDDFHVWQKNVDDNIALSTFLDYGKSILIGMAVCSKKICE